MQGVSGSSPPVSTKIIRDTERLSLIILVKPWLDHLAHKCANVVLPLAVMLAIITLEVRIESNCCSLGKIPLRGMRFLDAVRHPRFLTKTDFVGINTFSIFRRRAVLVL